MGDRGPHSSFTSPGQTTPAAYSVTAHNCSGFEIFVFTPVRCLRRCGAVRIAKQWHHAREKSKKRGVVTEEGNINFEGLRRFLSCVQTVHRDK